MVEIENIILVASLSAFILLFLAKIGVRERMQIYAPKLISELFSCDFCLSFWTCMAVSLVLFIFTKERYFLYAPIAATPITRVLI